MTTHSLLAVALLGTSALAQVVIFPPDYTNVPDGPFNAANLPLAFGTSRVQMVYETPHVGVPTGHQITKIGFREDGGFTSLQAGRSLQLEVRIGYTTFGALNLSATFDNNFVSPPTTVFGPAVFTLPALHDPAAPLTNGRLWVPITPFTFAPAAGQNLLIEYRVFGTSGGGAPFNYYLDRADYYSPVTSGPAGCPHTTGTAVLTVDPTAPGLGYSATMATGPAASPGLLAINIGSALVTPYSLTGVFGGINPACTGQISPVGLATLGNTTGSSGYANWYFGIPNNTAFSGLEISSQALFLDFFSPGGLVVSNGAQVMLGTKPLAAVLYVNGPPTASTTGSMIPNYCPVTFFEHN